MYGIFTYNLLYPNLGLNTPIPWIRHGIYFKPSTLSIDNTVDGRNPAPVDVVNILLFTTGFSTIPGGDRRISSINSMFSGV